MRALVRTLGSLLIAFGAFLWLYAAKNAPSNQPVAPVAVAPAVKPAPPPSKSRHHNEGAETKPPSPAPENQAPTHPAVSKAVLTVATPEQYRFIVDLHKEDGWFDTRIPITAELGVYEFCLPDGSSSGPCGGWVQAMVGGNVLKPSDTSPNNQATIDITTFLFGQNPDRSQHGQGSQFLQIPLQAVQTLKLRIVGANAPNELQKVMVKVHIGPNNQDQAQFTASQQLEMAQLAKWVNQ